MTNARLFTFLSVIPTDMSLLSASPSGITPNLKMLTSNLQNSTVFSGMLVELDWNEGSDSDDSTEYYGKEASSSQQTTASSLLSEENE